MVSTIAGELPTDPSLPGGTPSNGFNIEVAQNTTTYTYNGTLSAGTVYYWEVHAQGSTQHGTWSTKRSFTTAPAPITTFRFPLNDFTPYTCPISSAFDHSMPGGRYTANRIVTAFDGETGTVKDSIEPPATGTDGVLLYSYKKTDGAAFLSGVLNYDGTATGATTLNYDGHTGYDYKVASGTPVHAVADGWVETANADAYNPVTGKYDNPAGKYVRIQHDFIGCQTQYLHLSQISVSLNANVSRGQIIGYSGNTGNTTGPHLHFEVKKSVSSSWISIDPYGWTGAGSDPYTAATNTCLWEQKSVVNPVISANPSTISVSSAAAQKDILIRNDGGGTLAYSASVTQGNSWLSITSGATGTSGNNIHVSVAENLGADGKYGEITITGGSGVASVTVAVNQSGVIVNAGTLNVTLYDQNGIKADAAKTEVLLYVNANPQEKTGSNPATFTGIPYNTTDGYLVEGWSKSRFPTPKPGNEYELWDSKHVNVNSNTPPCALTRGYYPFLEKVEVSQQTSDGSWKVVSAGDTIFAGTMVRFDVNVMENNINTQNVRVHLSFGKNQNAPNDYYDFQLQSGQLSDPGNGDLPMKTFSYSDININAIVLGQSSTQFYYAVEVFTDIGGKPVLTDSLGATPTFKAKRASDISTTLTHVTSPMSGLPPIVWTGVGIYLFDDVAGGTIDPTKETWIVVHGRANSKDTSEIREIASAIKGCGKQVLLVDWEEGAKAFGPKDTLSYGEYWIPYVGAWIGEALLKYGFDEDNLCFVGHSWGSYVSYEVAKWYARGAGYKVKTIVALDPAADVPSYTPFGATYNPNDAVNFSSYSQHSWAFRGVIPAPSIRASKWPGLYETVTQFDGGFGNVTTATTANESYCVVMNPVEQDGLDFFLDPSYEAHDKVRAVFSHMLKNQTGGVSKFFSLDKLTSGHTWSKDQYYDFITTSNRGFETLIWTNPYDDVAEPTVPA
ncbi:MAG: peptidoglycan DD-metalloendopeptidase family protein, partial [Lentisphaerota bacterium]